MTKRVHRKTRFAKLVEKEALIRRNELLQKKSLAETHFESLLLNSRIFYVREKLNYDHVNNWCYTDFYIPYYKIAIEIDGKEHSSGIRHEKDIKKEFFLKKNRNISTIRFSNEECLSLNELSIDDILNKANFDKGYLQYLEHLKSKELKEIQKHYKFDVYSTFWIYDKRKRQKFRFDSFFDLKHYTNTAYRFLVNAYENREDLFVSNLYIIENSEELLDDKIKRYTLQGESN